MKIKDTTLTNNGAQLFAVDCQRFSDWRWQMKNQVISYEQAHKILELTDAEEQGFASKSSIFNIGVTPYYLALIKQCPQAGNAIRAQALPNKRENYDPIGESDPLSEVGSSPVREVVHIYPDRVAFCVAQLCSVYCRYCYRKRRDDEIGLHFNRKIVERGLQYISSNSSIKDVIVTGGDPLIASDSALENLLSQLTSIPHVEVIRIHTRTPVTLPYRITPKLVSMLSRFHPLWLNTHFNCAEELTMEASTAIGLLVNHGIPVGNQAVLLRGVNDSYERMHALCFALIKNRIRPYYLFHPHLIEGTDHLRVGIEQGLSIMRKLRGNISGFAIPTYILDTPSGKVPLTPQYLLGVDGNDVLVENNRGEIWREPNAWRL